MSEHISAPASVCVNCKTASGKVPARSPHVALMLFLVLQRLITRIEMRQGAIIIITAENTLDSDPEINSGI